MCTSIKRFNNKQFEMFLQADDFATIVGGGRLDACFRLECGSGDSFWYWKEVSKSSGHYYLAVNSIRASQNSPSEIMAFLKTNIESIFPCGAKGIDGSNVGEGQTFILTKYLPCSSNVVCTSSTDVQFVFHTVPGQHVLTGKVIFGVFVDACHETWIFQQGHADSHENNIQAVMNEFVAPRIWKAFARNLNHYLKEASLTQ